MLDITNEKSRITMHAILETILEFIFTAKSQGATKCTIPSQCPIKLGKYRKDDVISVLTGHGFGVNEAASCHVITWSEHNGKIQIIYPVDEHRYTPAFTAAIRNIGNRNMNWNFVDIVYPIGFKQALRKKALGVREARINGIIFRITNFVFDEMQKAANEGKMNYTINITKLLDMTRRTYPSYYNALKEYPEFTYQVEESIVSLFSPDCTEFQVKTVGKEIVVSWE